MSGKRKSQKMTGDGRLPGDPDRDALIHSMIRVDQAGEYGAKRIYEGQLAVFGAQRRRAGDRGNVSSGGKAP